MRLALACLLVLGILCPLPAAAWKGALEGGVRTIAEVREKAESGDHVVVQGKVIDVRGGHGELLIVELEDETGTVMVAVPEHLRRELDADPEVGRRARVAGKWDHKYMDSDEWGIRAQKVERLED